MSEEYLKIIYNPQTKTWKSVNYPYADLVKRSLGEQFLKTMRSTDANKIIDYFYDSQISKTAKEVYEQSIVIAMNLQRLGVAKGDVVVLFSMNNEWISVLTIGCILIGAVPNFCEVHLDDESTAYIFDILKPTALMYEEKYLSKIQKCLGLSKPGKPPLLISINGPQKPNVQHDLLKPPQNPIDFDHFKSVEIQDPQEEIVCLALTSGSTGVPKVVQLTHALVMHGTAIWWDNADHYAPLTGDSVVFSFSPLRWISQVVLMLQSMLYGVKRISSCGAPNGKYGHEVLRNRGITHIFVAPSIFYEILLQMDENNSESFSSLKMIQLGGEPPSQATLELTRKHAINAKVFHCYGMTEMISSITNDEHINGGKPCPGYELQILDENKRPLGVNEAGQIALKPPYPMKGYMGVNSAECYNERGLFINGDYGFMDDQHRLHILSRYKDLITSNGEILIPNALEYVVINLPEVYVARLAGYRKTPNDPNEIGAFFVVLNSNVSTTPRDISAKISATLKAHLSPKELAIIQDIHIVESVPLTTCGKLDRVALKKLALSKAQL